MPTLHDRIQGRIKARIASRREVREAAIEPAPLLFAGSRAKDPIFGGGPGPTPNQVLGRFTEAEKIEAIGRGEFIPERTAPTEIRAPGPIGNLIDQAARAGARQVRKLPGGDTAVKLAKPIVGFPLDMAKQIANDAVNAMAPVEGERAHTSWNPFQVAMGADLPVRPTTRGEKMRGSAMTAVNLAFPGLSKGIAGEAAGLGLGKVASATVGTGGVMAGIGATEGGVAGYQGGTDPLTRAQGAISGALSGGAQGFLSGVALHGGMAAAGAIGGNTARLAARGARGTAGLLEDYTARGKFADNRAMRGIFEGLDQDLATGQPAPKVAPYGVGGPRADRMMRPEETGLRPIIRKPVSLGSAENIPTGDISSQRPIPVGSIKPEHIFTPGNKARFERIKTVGEDPPGDEALRARIRAGEQLTDEEVHRAEPANKTIYDVIRAQHPTVPNTSIGAEVKRQRIRMDPMQEPYAQKDLHEIVHDPEQVIAGLERTKGAKGGDEFGSLDPLIERIRADQEAGKPLTAGRLRMHQRDAVIEHGKTDAINHGIQLRKQGVVIILAGPPGSGKSTIANRVGKFFGAYQVDADFGKLRDPRYQDIGANGVHEESSLIAEKARNLALARGENVILPTIGKNEATMRAWIQELRDSGHEVHYVLSDLSPEQSSVRAFNRSLGKGRVLHQHYVLNDVADKPQRVFDKLNRGEDVTGGRWLHLDQSHPNEVPLSDRVLGHGENYDTRSLDESGGPTGAGSGGAGPDTRPGDGGQPAPVGGVDRGLPGPNKADSSPGDVQGAVGRSDKLWIKDHELPFRYRVVEAESLIASNDPKNSFERRADYPAEIQGRVYHGSSGRGARERVVEMANDIQAGKLTHPSRSVSGPPIITKNRHVIVGNQRGMAQELAHQKGGAGSESLRASAVRDAELLGVDPREIEGMKHPVVVRELTEVDPADTQYLAKLNQLSDIAGGKAKSPLVQAAGRSRQLAQHPDVLEQFSNTIKPDETINEYLRTSNGPELLNAMVKAEVISPSELDSFRDPKTGKISGFGRERIGELFPLLALGGEPAIIDQAPAAILGKLEQSWVPAVRAGGLEPILKEAIELHTQRVDNGMKSIADLVGQGDMFGGSAEESQGVVLARFLESHKKADVTEAFRKYAAAIESSKRAGETGDIFGQAPETPAEAFDRAFTFEDARDEFKSAPLRRAGAIGTQPKKGIPGLELRHFSNGADGQAGAVQAWLNGKKVGHVSYKITGDGKIFPEDVEVHKDLRRQGIGSAMYDRMLKEEGDKPLAKTLRTRDGIGFRAGYEESRGLPPTPKGTSLEDELEFEDYEHGDTPYQGDAYWADVRARQAELGINSGPSAPAKPFDDWIGDFRRSQKSRAGRIGDSDPAHTARVISSLAGTGVGGAAGGAIGGQFGDTPEERRRNAALGMGLGAALGGGLPFAGETVGQQAARFARASRRAAGAPVKLFDSLTDFAHDAPVAADVFKIHATKDHVNLEVRGEPSIAQLNELLTHVRENPNARLRYSFRDRAGRQVSGGSRIETLWADLPYGESNAPASSPMYQPGARVGAVGTQPQLIAMGRRNVELLESKLKNPDIAPEEKVRLEKKIESYYEPGSQWLRGQEKIQVVGKAFDREKGNAVVRFSSPEGELTMIVTDIKGEKAHVEYLGFSDSIDAAGNVHVDPRDEGRLGPKLMRQAMREASKQFPEIREVSSVRVGGIHNRTGTPDVDFRVGRERGRAGAIGTQPKFEPDPLEKIVARHEQQGVEIYASQPKATPGVLVLDKIRTEKTLRGEGLGTKALQDLTRHADENGLTMALDVAREGNKLKLERWYKENGFVRNKGRRPEISEGWIREPKVFRNRTGAIGSQPDMFGHSEPAADQGGLFGDDAGRAGPAKGKAFTQAQEEARLNAEFLRKQLDRLEHTPVPQIKGGLKAVQKLRLMVADLERVANFDKSIKPEELSNRIAADKDPADLFSSRARTPDPIPGSSNRAGAVGDQPVRAQELEKFSDEIYNRPGEEDAHGREPDHPDYENPDQLGTCTTGACEVAEKFGGKTFGYMTEDNPTAKIGQLEDGHDFALIDDRYIVDPWSKHVANYSDKATLDLENPVDAAKARELYGPRSKWTAGEDHTVKSGLKNRSGAIGTQPESIAKAAFKLESGEVVTGLSHGHIYDDLDKAGKLEYIDEEGEGFVTSTGRFVGRHEAYKIAARQKQITARGRRDPHLGDWGGDRQVATEDLKRSAAGAIEAPAPKLQNRSGAIGTQPDRGAYLGETDLLNVSKIVESSTARERIAEAAEKYRTTRDGNKQTWAESDPLVKAAVAEIMAHDPKARLPHVQRKLTGIQLLARRDVIRQNDDLIEALSKKISGRLTEAEREHASSLLSKAVEHNDALLSDLIVGSSQKGRDLNLLKRIANKSLDHDVWQIQAKRMLGPDRPLDDATAAQLRKLVNEAKEACG